MFEANRDVMRESHREILESVRNTRPNEVNIRNYFNNRGLDLSMEVFWVCVGQGTAKLQAVKIGDMNKILPLSQSSGSSPG